MGWGGVLRLPPPPLEVVVISLPSPPAVLCRPAAPAAAGGADGGGRAAPKGHLRLVCRFPRHRCGLRKQLRHLHPGPCEWGRESLWSPSPPPMLTCPGPGGADRRSFWAPRSSPRSPHTPLSSCPTRTGWRCCSATRTRASTSTPTGASSRTWSCSGGRCPPPSVSRGGFLSPKAAVQKPLDAGGGGCLHQSPKREEGAAEKPSTNALDAFGPEGPPGRPPPPGKFVKMQADLALRPGVATGLNGQWSLEGHRIVIGVFGTKGLFLPLLPRTFCDLPP